MKPLQGNPPLRSVSRIALCGASGVKTKTLSTKKKGAWTQASIEVSRRGVEKCFFLTSSLIGLVKWGFFANYAERLSPIAQEIG
jgi:hypothetical protein